MNLFEYDPLSSPVEGPASLIISPGLYEKRVFDRKRSVISAHKLSAS